MVETFMNRALELAAQGIGFTAPNPCVGAVIVKGGVVVGEGWHRRAGEDHAELIAIRQVMKKSGIRTVDIDSSLFHNATLYTTLEPCVHHGKTPPCADLIVKAGFQKVCVGMKDPFKFVNGKGIKYLKDRGVNVELCKKDSALFRSIRALNQPFIKWAVSGMPYVILKSGISVDGKIATCTRDSRWITSELARKDSRQLRSQCDAVMIGAGTINVDDPELNLLPKYSKKDFLKIVIDGKLTSDIKSKVFAHENVLLVYSDVASKGAIAKFKNANVRMKSFGKAISFKRLFKFLAKEGIQSVFVEGGSHLNGTLFDETLRDPSLLDKVVFYIAPKIIGGNDSLSVIAGKGVTKVRDSLTFLESRFTSIDDDVRFEGVRNFY